MAAHTPTSGRQEVCYSVPQCLLRLRGRADAHQGFDGEGIQLWLDYEFEALRYGVDPDISRKELEALVKGSTVVLPCEQHRAGHESDFVRWGRRGGRETFQRYGRAWFVLLAWRRWKRNSASELAAAFGGLL